MADYNYLTRAAGQGHPFLQLSKNLLLQHAQPSSTDFSSILNSIITFSVHQVVIDTDQGFIMGLLEKHRADGDFCNGGLFSV